jgi:hypothetical protein
MANPSQYSPAQAVCPMRAGLERHIWPAGDGKGIVTETSSDTIFGPEGLGLAGGPWARLLSFLARTGIQEQTGSKPGETDIEACVRGWGQGAFSSRVFDKDLGVDQAQLERFIAHLQAIAGELGVPNQRITGKVLAVFITTQAPEPYLTKDGLRTVSRAIDRLEARFRGHIQWQGFVTLCGQIGRDGIKHVTPELLRAFFNSEVPFFEQVIDRRHRLRDGSLTPGDKSRLLLDAPVHVDLVATDREYKRNKSGLWIILKIVGYMLTSRRSALGPLLKA